MLLRLIVASVPLLLSAGCQEEPQVGPPSPPVINPYPDNDPIERQISALARFWGGDWYAPEDYFAPVDYFLAGSIGLRLTYARGSTVAMLKPLIAQGTTALPHLIAHLSDRRITGLHIAHGGGLITIGSMYWRGEYDAGAGHEPEELLGIGGIQSESQRHDITVGDLCFFAIGQIVNRHFDPVQQVWTLSIAIDSPTGIPVLATRVATDWSGLTPQAHRDSLLADFKAGGNWQAMLRLAFYYPLVAEPLALDELRRPVYSSDIVDEFMARSLYATTDPQKWERALASLIAEHGPAYRDGVLNQLLQDCRYQEGEKAIPAGKILTHLFPNVDRATRPSALTARELAAKADVVRGVSPLRSEKLDAEAYLLFQSVNRQAGGRRENYLAIACMERLIGKGHDAQLAAFCANHRTSDEDEADDLKEILRQLRKNMAKMARH